MFHLKNPNTFSSISGARVVTVACMFLFGLLQIAFAQSPLPVKWAFEPVFTVESVAFSKDGSLLAVGGAGGVCVYSASTGLPYRGFATSAVGIGSVAFSPDGKWLAVGGNSSTSAVLEVWNVTTGALVQTFAADGTSVGTVAFTPDGTALAIGGSTFSKITLKSAGVLEVWQIASSKRLMTLGTTAVSVNSVAFTGDGKLLIAGGGDGTNGTLEWWNMSSGVLQKKVVPANSNYVASLALAPDGKTIALGGLGKTGPLLQIVDGTTGVLVKALASGIGSVINTVAISPDGKTLADVGADYTPFQNTYIGKGRKEIWELPNYIPGAPQNDDGWALDGVAFSPDGSKLVSGGVDYSWVGTGQGGAYEPDAGFITALDLASNSSTTTITGQTNQGPSTGIGAPVFSPDGKLVAGGVLDYTAGSEQAFNLWDAATGLLRFTMPTHATSRSSNAFSPDGKSLAIAGTYHSLSTATFSGVLEVWSVGARSLIVSLVTDVENNGRVAFSPDGKLIADGGLDANGNALIEVWDLGTGSLRETLHSSATFGFTGLSFSPDGTTLADSGSLYVASANAPYNGLLELWNVSTGELKTTLKTSESGVQGISFSPDGKTLAAGGYVFTLGYPQVGIVELWNVPTRNLITTLPMPSETTNVLDVGYAPDGKTLFATATAGSPVLVLFDAIKSKPLGYFDVGFAGEFALSPDGAAIAYGIAAGGLGVSTIQSPTSASIQSLSLSPSAIREIGTTKGTVTLSHPAPKGGVSIGLQAGTDITVSTTVTVPAGLRSATFTVSSGWTGANVTIPITASSGPYSLSTNLTVFAPDLQAFGVQPSSTTGGSPLSGTVRISSPAGMLGDYVLLNSSQPGVVVPGGALVLSGHNTATVVIRTAAVDTKQKVTMTASSGKTSRSVTVTVLPAALMSITVNPSTVTGGGASTATVTLNGPAGPNGVVVRLNSNRPAVVVTSTVTIPPGSSSATISITTQPVSGTVNATLTAVAGGVTRTVQLIVR
ncbi:MAG: hypothetical protein P4L46_06180 [Fimbriimonas sp.]|nr:hypothetical protein [Fimbriimonas sp.]